MLDVINYLNNDIRTVEISGQVWYSVVDVIAILSESNTPRKYWSDLKSKLDFLEQLKKEVTNG